MDKNKFYQNIQKAFENLPENFSILEEQIDVKIQVKYFEYAKEIRDKQEKQECFEQRELLFEKDTDEEQKKKILSSIASFNNVKAYRTIEKFVAKNEGELKQWGILALQESRMLLQSSLLDEQQFFISTGLGGKGKKLRYFIVFLNADKTKGLTPTQQNLLKDELIFELKKHDGEFESIEFTQKYSSALIILPITVALQNVFRNVIDECNQYGNFLLEDFIVTNVKILSGIEIEQMLTQKQDQHPSDAQDSQDFRDE